MDHRGAVDLTGVSSFKKGEQPHKGEGMGAWSGLPDRSLMFKLGLGSEAILGFDTSTLTLDDFESMRFHPQVNASLTALTFMIHQADWHVECEDKRIKEMVEENLRAIWTRLIRSMGNALWAGYSPAILEFENDAQGRYTIINKVKDLHPAEAKVKWKKHDGTVAGQKRSWYTFDGIDQIGWGHIPALNSFWYPLLMEQGDMSGRKLLRAAFMPWYFSLVMHIYTNRYFERFGEPLPIGRAPFEETIVEPDGKSWTGKQLMETMLINLRNRGAVVLPSDRDSSTGTGAQAYTWDIDYLECVDTETEILTDHGWKSYDQLKVGDMALTLNHETGMSEFQSVDKVNIHQVEDREMLCMEGATHSSVTTMNHRWPVVGPKEKYRDWRFSGELQRRDRIPLIADRVDFPVDPKYDDAMVEAIAWYWAEGHTYQRDGKPINYISITQKRFPERIRSALTRLFGPAVESFPRNTWTNERSGVPMWRENFKKSDESIRQFFLNYEASELLQSVAPDRIVTYDFINSLTKSQLDLYIDTALAADGNQTAAQSFLMQKDKRKAEMFQYACTLAGHATSIYSQPDKRHEDYVMWIVSIRRRRYLHPKNAVNTGNAFTMTTKKHTGIVWCPTTRNATWLARRRGTVYFTGNSQMRGVDFERYLTRLDEEISLALFTPLLLMRNADVGSHNLGVQHVQTWMWFLNALLGDMKEYVDRYICERLKAINFSEKAPRCEWVPKKLGKENVETVRAIATELLRQGIAKPDLEQMGTALGMDLTEIRQVQPTNPNAPQEDDRDRTERDRSTDGPGGVGSSPTPGSRTGTLAARISQNLWGTWSSGTVQISPLTATEIMHWGQKATNVQSALETLNGMDTGDFESPGDVVMIAAKVIGAIEAA